MVFEQLIEPTWLEKRAWYATVLGFFYSVIGIEAAILIFPSDPSYMAVAFTALFILPSINSLLTKAAKPIQKKGKLNLIRLFSENIDIFKVYFYLFAGIFIAYSAAMLVLPSAVTSNIFKSQLRVGGLAGDAIFASNFTNIFFNNLKVMAVVFALSILYGAGAMIFLTWNAAAWGVVAGAYSKMFATGSSVGYYLNDFILRLPHTVLESSAYIFVAIAGGVLSKAVLQQNIKSKGFKYVLYDGLMFFAIAIIALTVGATVEAFLLGKWF